MEFGYKPKPIALEGIGKEVEAILSKIHCSFVLGDAKIIHQNVLVERLLDDGESVLCAVW